MVAHRSLANSVLVVGPAWVGDMVMAQSLFKALKREDSSSQIDVIAPGWSEPLLARMPEVRRAITLPVAHGELGLAKRWRLGRKLRDAGYNQAIILPRSAKAAVVPWVAGIPVRTGYRGEHRYGLLNDIRPLDKNRLYRTVDRFVALATDTQRTAIGVEKPEIIPPQLTSTPAQQASAMQAHGLITNTPALALCPGAEYGPAKRWPAEYFAALARDYLAADWQVWLLGSGKDTEFTRNISEQAKGVMDLAGKTSLAQAIDLLAASDAVVSNDSGLMHIAAATGTPLVAVYGSSDPQYTPPLSDQAKVLYLNLECSPCFERECPLGHLNCLRELTPTKVSTALATLVKTEH